MPCRAAGDSDTEAQVLLQQARLASLVRRPEVAIDLLQAAQAIGGGLQLWRDSLALYATVRGGMRSGGWKDAVDALTGGLAMMAALARCVEPGQQGVTAHIAHCMLWYHRQPSLVCAAGCEARPVGRAELAVLCLAWLVWLWY